MAGCQGNGVFLLRQVLRRLGRRLAQDLVELVLECQLLLLQRFDDKVRCRFDARFHVPDSLVEFVVLFIDIEEMAVGRLELGNQVTVFGEHGVFSMRVGIDGERRIVCMAIPGMQKANPGRLAKCKI